MFSPHCVINKTVLGVLLCYVSFLCYNGGCCKPDTGMDVIREDFSTVAGVGSHLSL